MTNPIELEERARLENILMSELGPLTDDFDRLSAEDQSEVVDRLYDALSSPPVITDGDVERMAESLKASASVCSSALGRHCGQFSDYDWLWLARAAIAAIRSRGEELEDGRPASSGGQPATQQSPSPTSGLGPAGECQAQGALLEEIVAHLGAAKMQTLPSDDPIIAEHVRAAHELAVIAWRQEQRKTA